MSKPRLTAIDRLANVIEVVELGRRTGLLAVERGSGSVTEEGSVYFMTGRPIYAALGSLRGREALAVLARWGECHFAFDPSAPSPVPNVSSTSPGAGALDWPDDGPYSPAPRSSGMTPPPNDGASGWRMPFGSSSDSSGYNGSGFTGPISRPASAPTTHGLSSGPSTYGGPSRTFGSSGVSSGNTGSWGRMSSPGESGGQPSGPGYGTYSDPMLQRRPRRAPDVRDLMSVVTAYNLSRSHRAVLLLANGEYTVLDLARLSSKPVGEVAQMLADLEARGLIYYY